ncbi:MAG: CBS domain-containing protein [Acidimicrobiales bacterium]
MAIILIVDGDPAGLELLERDIGRRYGDEHRVESTTSGESALAACARLRDGPNPVALVLAAELLPDSNGSAILLGARAMFPEVGRVLVTSHADVEAAMAAINDTGIDQYLASPWQSPEDTLYPVIDELLADWRERIALPYRRVRDVMQGTDGLVGDDADLRQAAEVVASTRIGDLMVVDPDGAFVGVLSEGDILRNALPDLDEILAAGGSLYDAYQLFMGKAHALADRPILPLVIREPLVMHPDDHVAKAATILIERQIRRLPVVDDGRLVGTVSRADICRAVVSTP